MALIRNEPIEVRYLTGWQTVIFGLILSIPFTALISLIMKSVLRGIAVLAGIFFGIMILGLFFRGVIWVCSNFLPLRSVPLAKMAVNNLRRRSVTVVFVMIALFIGVLSMSLGILVWQISGAKISAAQVGIQRYNVDILASADQEEDMRQAVQVLNPKKISIGYRTQLESIRLVSDGSAIPSMDSVLVGRSDPQDYVLSGTEWGSSPEGVYAYESSGIETGSQIEAIFHDGTRRILTVVGLYNINYDSMNLYPPTGLLMNAEVFRQVAQPDSLTVFVQIDPGQVKQTVNDLGNALPQATVINLEAYASRLMQSYQKLYTLPIALAGLALLAGLLLLANSVSLAVIDRQYEIGIFKTIGYSRGQILSMFAVEYGLVSLLATGVALLVVQGFLALLALAERMDASILLLNASSLGIATSCGIGLCLATVLWVVWSPTQVSPVAVLNERN